MLIEAFQQGDEFAFVALYNRYKGPVYAFCAKMLLDRAAAQDVMQETFVRVYEHRQRLRRAGSFKSWLFTDCAQPVSEHPAPLQPLHGV